MSIRPRRFAVPPLAILAVALLSVLLVGTLAATVAAQGRGDGDKDGLWDRWERRWGVTDPGRRDTDRDGIRDGMEDEDGDRLSNAGEMRFRTDPTNPDSDGDGTRDGGEDSNRNGIRDALEQDRRAVPVDLTPALDEAFWDVPPSYANGCHTDAYSAIIHPCVYGDADADVSVAVFGDSHALQWLPALDKAGARSGWRVTTLTRTACPSVDVEFRGAAFEGTEKPCRRWRAAAFKWLSANPQDVVIITNASRYPLVDASGQRVYAPNKEALWQEGLARTLVAMPDETTALVLADTPNLRSNPVSCLKQDWTVVSDCVTRRAATRVPEHDQAERETAAAHGALFDELNHVVCPYDPCPILSGRTLMWRNESHLTATYARQLAPAVRGLVERALASRDDDPSAEPGASPLTLQLVVHDDRFDPAVLDVPAGRELLLTVRNAGREQHRVSFYRADGAPLDAVVTDLVIDPGSSATMALTISEPGTYSVVDDRRPQVVPGTLEAREPG